MVHQAPPASRSSAKWRSRAHVYGKVDYLGASMERLASYRQQLVDALCTAPAKVLLVGKGDGIVEDLLLRAGVDVTTLDLDENLQPDVVGSVESIPIDDGAFDVSVCCQVLEHLPFDRFTGCLRELRRVTTDRLVLSLPDVRPFLSLRLRLPKLDIDRQISLPRIPPRVVTPERFARCSHHWEIGFRSTGYRAVRGALAQSGWHVLHSRRVIDLSWHCFFYCQRTEVNAQRTLHH